MCALGAGECCRDFLYGLGAGASRTPAVAGGLLRSCATFRRDHAPRSTPGRGRIRTRAPTRSWWNFVRVGVQLTVRDLAAAAGRPRGRGSAALTRARAHGDRRVARRPPQLMRLMDATPSRPCPQPRCGTGTTTLSIRTAGHDFHTPASGSGSGGGARARRPHASTSVCARARSDPRNLDGRRAGPRVPARLRGGRRLPLTDIDEISRGCSRTAPACSTPWGLRGLRPARVGWVMACAPGAQRSPPAAEFVALDHVLHDMRLYKRGTSSRCCASARSPPAHQRAMRFCRPGATGYQVVAELLHEFRRHNADTPTTRSWAAAVTAHPSLRGEQPGRSPTATCCCRCGLRAGCYASDITALPVNGRFTPEQRAVYEVVLEANRAAIERVRPGNTGTTAPGAVRVITQGLVSSGSQGGSPGAHSQRRHQRSSCTARVIGSVWTCNGRRRLQGGR